MIKLVLNVELRNSQGDMYYKLIDSFPFKFSYLY